MNTEQATGQSIGKAIGTRQIVSYFMYVLYERTTTSPSDLKNGAFSFFKVSRKDTAMTLKVALKQSFWLFKVTWGPSGVTES